jgi:hypothetical protein
MDPAFRMVLMTATVTAATATIAWLFAKYGPASEAAAAASAADDGGFQPHQLRKRVTAAQQAHLRAGRCGYTGEPVPEGSVMHMDHCVELQIFDHVLAQLQIHPAAKQFQALCSLLNGDSNMVATTNEIDRAKRAVVAAFLAQPGDRKSLRAMACVLVQRKDEQVAAPAIQRLLASGAWYKIERRMERAWEYLRLEILANDSRCYTDLIKCTDALFDSMALCQVG